jgi:hypothetical protein
LFYDETQDKNPSRAVYIKAVKADFLENLTREIDTVIEKLEK